MILEMIAQCEMTDEIVRQLDVSASYVNRLRWETGPTLLSRSANEDEPESRSLNIELTGEAKARYKAVRQYRELCRKHGIEWTVSGFHTYIRTLEKKRNCERKRRRKKLTAKG